LLYFLQSFPQCCKHSKSYIKDWVPGAGSEDYVVSATIKAVKAKS